MKYLLSGLFLLVSISLFGQKNIKNSLILLENKQNILPILSLENYEITVTNLHEKLPTFNQTLTFYQSLKSIGYESDSLVRSKLDVMTSGKLTIPTSKNNPKKAKNTQTIDKMAIVTYFPTENDSLYAKYLKVTDSLLKQHAISIIFVHFGTPETLPAIEKLTSFKAVLIANDSSQLSQSLAAQAIFGAVASAGKLQQPLRSYAKNYGLNTPQLSRLQYGMPEMVELTTQKLTSIDSIIEEALRQKAMPGCQVLVAKQGRVFYHKAFGYHTYDSLQKVTLTDVYDLASVTKILAGTLAVMKLTEDKKINLDKRLSEYLSEFKKSDKNEIILREMYAHQARFPAGVGTWQTLKSDWFSKITTKKFPIKVADSLFTKAEVATTILQNIKKATLLPQKQYLYSDLPFILTTFLVKRITKQDLASFVTQQFYKSLGAKLIFTPTLHYKKEEIIPTEYDSLFRKQQVHGTVHDETAALLGGVSGHAGLFGSANEVAKLAQFYLQKGEYGGKTYLKSETITEFTRSQYLWEGLGNYRGVGFNRPSMNPTLTGHTAVSVSQQSYGHSGFTGTYVWIDADNELVYVFLSNRVYPTRKNQQLMDLNTRTRVLEKVYELLK